MQTTQPHAIYKLVLAKPFLPQSVPTPSTQLRDNSPALLRILYPLDLYDAHSDAPQSSFLHMLSLATGLAVKKSTLCIPYKGKLMALAKYCVYHELWEPVFTYSVTQASYVLESTGFTKAYPYICEHGRTQLATHIQHLWSGRGRAPINTLLGTADWNTRPKEYAPAVQVRKNLYGAATAEEFLLDILSLKDTPKDIKTFLLASEVGYNTLYDTIKHVPTCAAAFSLTDGIK